MHHVLRCGLCSIHQELRFVCRQSKTFIAITYLLKILIFQIPQRDNIERELIYHTQIMCVEPEILASSGVSNSHTNRNN